MTLDRRIGAAAAAVRSARAALRQATERRTAANTAAIDLMRNAAIAERAEKSAALSDMVAGVRRLLAQNLTVSEVAVLCGLPSTAIDSINRFEMSFRAPSPRTSRPHRYSHQGSESSRSADSEVDLSAADPPRRRTELSSLVRGLRQSPGGPAGAARLVAGRASHGAGACTTVHLRRSDILSEDLRWGVPKPCL
jgi:hypothetical protein